MFLISQISIPCHLISMLYRQSVYSNFASVINKNIKQILDLEIAQTDWPFELSMKKQFVGKTRKMNSSENIA